MSDTEKRTYTDKFMLRLPDGMRDQLRLLAEANNRSMNSEIVTRLEHSLNAPDFHVDGIGQTLEFVAEAVRMLQTENDLMRGQIARIQEKYGPLTADDWSKIEGQNVAVLKKQAQRD